MYFTDYEFLMPYKRAVEYWTKLAELYATKVIEVTAEVLLNKPALKN